MKAKLVVARNIRRLRVKLDLSQEALAVDAKIESNYVSRLERALENPSLAVLERLAKALNADIRELFDAARAAHGPVKPLRSGRKRK